MTAGLLGRTPQESLTGASCERRCNPGGGIDGRASIQRKRRAEQKRLVEHTKFRPTLARLSYATRQWLRVYQRSPTLSPLTACNKKKSSQCLTPKTRNLICVCRCFVSVHLYRIANAIGNLRVFLLCCFLCAHKSRRLGSRAIGRHLQHVCVDPSRFRLSATRCAQSEFRNHGSSFVCPARAASRARS